MSAASPPSFDDDVPAAPPEPQDPQGPRGGAVRCLWCGAFTPPVSVHGHLQCPACGLNTEPCCGGETAVPSAE